MGNRILIVEDEARLNEVLCDYFASRGDEPYAALDGMQALEMAESLEFDAVLLDIMMPELDGFSVCRALRRNSDVPIIFLTAMSDEDDKLKGFQLGADDYVTKPFTMSVLYAKTAALINRSRGSMMTGGRLKLGGVSIDLNSHRVFDGLKELELTPKEYALLCCLARNRNTVMSREQLLVKCWGYDYDGDTRAVDTHIRRLREKLGKHADMIKTVIKAGYMLEV